MKYDFADDLRGPDPRRHHIIAVALGSAVALLTAFIFVCFAWVVS